MDDFILEKNKKACPFIREVTVSKIQLLRYYIVAKLLILP